MRIRKEEAIPVYECLGDVRDLLVGRTNLAQLLIKRGGPGDRQEARQLLRMALQDARRMQIPEAQQIERILRGLGESA